MTTTESPQGQPVPTEPIDDEVLQLMGNAQFAVSLLQQCHRVVRFDIENGWPVFTQEFDPVASQRHRECCDEIDRLSQNITRRLSAQPSGATVSRGDVREQVAQWLCESNIGMNGGPGSWEERQHMSAYPEYQSPITVGESCRSYADELLALITTPTETQEEGS